MSEKNKKRSLTLFHYLEIDYINRAVLVCGGFTEVPEVPVS